MNSIAGVVLCAGQGTRMKSERSKMLHSVAGVPVCCWPVSVVQKLCAQTVVVVGYQGDDVKAAISNRLKGEIRFALQKEQNGTGDAVSLALAQVPREAESILVVCGDTPLLCAQSLQNLLEVHEKHAAKVTFLTARVQNPSGYGRIIREGASVHQIVEDSDATPEQRQIKEINAGIYVFDAAFLRAHIDSVQNQNAKKERYLTDLIATARTIYGPDALETCDIAAEEIAGINDRVQLAFAEGVMRQRLNTHWMLQGVTMIDPSTVYLDADVQLSADVTLYPNVMIKGRTTIAQGAVVYANTVIEDAAIGEKVQVGPFARLRAGTRLDEESKIGNFVEVKNTHLNKKSKASHLAYLGDAEIGAHCNIGAGTITCNYDGFHKHKTVIGEESFVGSNATLVAPLTIGAKAYVGAGSTVTQEVPDDALAIGRARQENKLGLAARLRERLRYRSV